MNYFLANYQQSKTELNIITDTGNTIASKEVELSDKDYVKQLAKEIIELSHEYDLYHNDLNGIGLVIKDFKDIHYTSEASLISDLESTFGFKAVVDSDSESLISTLTK
ncbi:hypothetical protein [Mammaliicoccus sp. Dog046]|uniref:hypothetical protein n=1 Tax=Mammaliicoccus sp. Dog046 TaxID=3034233 RepID=UPI002B262605|nr:hypothetical protein [Mammaliicoccus sp. Dog046]WQK85387.1 hypothetical protein P3U32_12390 [Mammaliicoccus sp. Dog046]